MAIKRDKIIVVDVESTCWQAAPPPGEETEIIEVGLCLLTMDSKQLEGKRSILVRPERSTVSEFCTRLTTLTQEMVDEGVSFPEACALLQGQYDTGETIWASWGDYDRRIFQAQCEVRAVPFPFSGQHINAKALFAKFYGKRMSIGGGLRVAALPAKGHEHRGDDDAWNTGRLLVHMMENYGDNILSLT